MRRIFSILIVLTACWNLQAQPADSTAQIPAATPIPDTTGWASQSNEQLIEKAASLYSRSQFEAAARMYEFVVNRFGPSHELYFNLGNSYYKCERLAPAILNYERALRLKPGDSDTRFNLEMCRARIVDKVDVLGQFMISRWFNDARNLCSSNCWAMISIGFFLLVIGCLFLYFFARVSWLKKTGFFTGILALVLSVWTLTYSAQQHKQLTHSDAAILYTLSVTVKSSPDQSGTDLFVLHEGTKMKVLSVLGGWTEIELEDGNVGWLESKHIVVI